MGFWDKMVENVRGMLYVTRYPATDKSSRVMTALWVLAGALAVWSVTRYVLDQDWGQPLLWMNVVILGLDVFMLHLSIRGVFYRREINAYVKRMVEESSINA